MIDQMSRGSVLDSAVDLAGNTTMLKLKGVFHIPVAANLNSFFIAENHRVETHNKELRILINSIEGLIIDVKTKTD